MPKTTDMDFLTNIELVKWKSSDKVKKKEFYTKKNEWYLY